MPAVFAHRIERQRWYVVFQGGKYGAFWSLYTSPPWRHCWAFRAHWVEGQPGLLNTCYALKIEQLRSMTDTDYWFAHPDDIAQFFLQQERVTDIVRIDVDVDQRKRYIPRGLFSCVSVIKAAMQMQAWWLLTPRQLHRHLISRGGVSLRSNVDGRSGR